MALRMMRRAAAWMLLAALAGCRSAPPVDYTVWWTPVTPYVPNSASDNAFDDYCLAAKQAETDDALGINRVSFTPGQKKESQGKLKAALALFNKGMSKKCEFEYRAAGPFEKRPYLSGWRLIGRSLIWDTEFALETNSTGLLIERSGQITKFATDLLGGGAMEADLGLSLLDEFRRAIAPRLREMNPKVLAAISDSMVRHAMNPNWLNAVVLHEKEGMLASVQWVQDHYKAEDFQPMTDSLGEEAAEAIHYLVALRQRDGQERHEYFKGFASEVDYEVNTVQKALKEPRARRGELAIPEGRRPWRRLSKQFFRTIRPLLKRHDYTLARTRLLILECRLQAQVKSIYRAPGNLSNFPKELTMDPVSGQPFAYTALGNEFKLYSVGEDLRDNGGRTNDSFSSPDLVLEKGF